MENASGIYYQVELSNGQSCKAVRLSVIDDIDTPNINNVSITVLDISYEEAKKLSTDVTGLKISYCRPTAPAEYISAPEIIKVENYDSYGADPLIESYYSYGYTIRFFKITDELLMLKDQEKEIEDMSIGIASMFETALLKEV